MPRTLLPRRRLPRDSQSGSPPLLREFPDLLLLHSPRSSEAPRTSPLAPRDLPSARETRSRPWAPTRARWCGNPRSKWWLRRLRSLSPRTPRELGPPHNSQARNWHLPRSSKPSQQQLPPDWPSHKRRCSHSRRLERHLQLVALKPRLRPKPWKRLLENPPWTTHPPTPWRTPWSLRELSLPMKPQLTRTPWRVLPMKLKLHPRRARTPKPSARARVPRPRPLVPRRPSSESCLFTSLSFYSLPH